MIQWNESLSVGVKEIDEQHQSLVEMINSLYEAMKGKEDKDFIKSLVTKLKNYAIYHFDTEENYMQKHQYIAFADHKAKHKDFCIKVFEIENSIKSSQNSVSMEILNFLTDWLINHINSTDKKMGEFLKTVEI